MQTLGSAAEPQPVPSALAIVSEAPQIKSAEPAAGFETAAAAAEPDYIELVPPSPRVSGDVRYLPDSRYASRVKQRPQNTDNRH